MHKIRKHEGKKGLGKGTGIFNQSSRHLLRLGYPLRQTGCCGTFKNVQ